MQIHTKGMIHHEERTRMFGGNTFHYNQSVILKQHAEKIVKGIRENGHLARFVKVVTKRKTVKASGTGRTHKIKYEIWVGHRK